MFVGGKVGVMAHDTTIMLLAPNIGGDGLNIWRLCNKLNTQVALFLVLIVDFLWSNRDKLINNQQTLYNPRGQKPTGNLTRRIETTLRRQKDPHMALKGSS